MADDPRANRLLAALPELDWHRVRHQLEPVTLTRGQVLYESGVAMSHAYFPTTAIASLMYVTEEGASSGIAVVGLDGMVGVPLLTGAGSTPGRAVVQSAGTAFRMAARPLKAEFMRAGPTMNVLLRYTQTLISQMAQIVVCTKHHTVNEQLCRWLLMHLDRLPGAELVVTHEMISQLLGVRREGITEAALSLQTAGLIAYRRGHITVLDRAGLENRACECHAVILAEYERLLPAADSEPKRHQRAGGHRVASA
jgi:CRP-like cAMP-binding protein